MKPNLGDVVADKYRLERVLGEGGMSTVFAASNVLTGKQVAIKWLHPEIVRDDEQCQRLLREAQATSAIDHPNVVNVFDVGRHEGALFLVMELLHGEPLSSLLGRNEQTQVLAPTEFAKLMMPVLRGVQAAHRKGVVHRDLKPDNIFICRDPHDGELREPKVLDFGISKLTHAQGKLDHELTREGTVFGTPQYMAPEQMRDARVADVRSDIYALGVMFYRALSRQYPYDADTVTALAILIVEGNARPLIELVPDIDIGFSDTVMRALAVDPDQRFQSVAAFAHALEPYAGGVLFSPGGADWDSASSWRLDSSGGFSVSVPSPARASSRPSAPHDELTTTALPVEDIAVPPPGRSARDERAPDPIRAPKRAPSRPSPASADEHDDVVQTLRLARSARGSRKRVLLIGSALFAVGLASPLGWQWWQEPAPGSANAGTEVPPAQPRAAASTADTHAPHEQPMAALGDGEHADDSALRDDTRPPELAAQQEPTAPEAVPSDTSLASHDASRALPPDRRRRTGRGQDVQDSAALPPTPTERVDDSGPLIQAERNPYLRR